MTNKPNDVRVSRELLQQWLDDIGESRHVTQYAATKREQLLALLAQPADQQGEPAAWQAMAIGEDGEIYRNVARAGRTALTVRDARFAWGEGVLERFELVIRPLFADPATAHVIELPEPYAVIGDYAACGGSRAVWSREFAEKIDDRMCEKTDVYDRASLEAAGIRVKP